jgi:hypothetical protein
MRKLKLKVPFYRRKSKKIGLMSNETGISFINGTVPQITIVLRDSHGRKSAYVVPANIRLNFNLKEIAYDSFWVEREGFGKNEVVEVLIS